MKALRNFILVKESSNEKTSNTGLFLGKVMPDELGRGEVVSIGEKVELDIKVGDIIQFKKVLAAKTMVDGEEYYAVGQDLVYLCE